MKRIIKDGITLNVDDKLYDFLNTEEPHVFSLDEIRPVAKKAVIYVSAKSAQKRSRAAGLCNMFMSPVIYPLTICILLNKTNHAKWLYESFDLELAADEYQAFRIAVRYGRLDAIQEMAAWSPREYDGIREQ
ncbi:MAG: hypothetical protein P1U34_10370 [Coxiellaceae bacterium]|nr:hypothetical protein [Coxiellaceae bacterium]